MSATVSVVIPNHNRFSQLRCCLASILAQSYPVSEIIVVDDCSDLDKFLLVEALVGEFEDKGPNITLVRNEANRGANYSRNRGVQLARGEYIAFIDSDDAWLPGKLSRQLEAIDWRKGERRPWVLGTTGRYRVNENGEILCIQCSQQVLTPQSIRNSNFIGTLSSVLVHREALLAVGGFDEKLGAGQDWDLFIRLCGQVDHVIVPEPLLIYVDHQEQRITLNSSKRLRAHMRIYAQHIRPFGLVNLNLHEYFRTLAEDCQNTGNRRRAEHFYARSLDNAAPLRWVRGKLYYPIRCWLCCTGLNEIRARRYKRYQARFQRQARQLGEENIKAAKDEIKTILGASLADIT
ncbi:Putative teichuronic acid biosynthesis glycosyltransferase TuaG [Roseibium album]|nr:Putative teichuronic acid biosynthesis glycosyltransferase TuaG [Roseibium album]